MSKKVCMFVLNNFTHDTRVLKEARTLTDAGYEVSVVALLDKTTKSYEEIGGVNVTRVPNYPFTIKILRCARGLRKSEKAYDESQKIASVDFGEMKEMGVRAYFNKVKKDNPIFFFSINETILLSYGLYLAVLKLAYTVLRKTLMPLNLMPLRFLYWYQRTLRVVSASPADIYHAHDLNTLPVGYWAARRHGAKLVYDSHELYLERNTLRPTNRLGKFLLGRMEAFLIRRANAVITVNGSISKELAERYRIKLPYVVMNTPARCNNTKVREGVNPLRDALKVDPSHHLLVYSGGITFNRGLEKIIESLIYLPDCHLVLMGYGKEEYKKKLIEAAHRAGVAERVSFFGPVPPDEVTIYVAGADLGIAPIENVCLSYYYCSPNKIFEYIAGGVPVIASDFPELKKVISQYAIGITFDPSDARDIERAVRQVLDDKENLGKMKANTLAATKAYNWEHETKKLLRLYNELG